MSEREELLKAVEKAELDYEAIKYQHSHESSIALRCLEQAQEKLDEFDGVTDSQRIEQLECQLAEARETIKETVDHLEWRDEIQGGLGTLQPFYEKLKEQLKEETNAK